MAEHDLRKAATEMVQAYDAACPDWWPAEIEALREALAEPEGEPLPNDIASEVMGNPILSRIAIALLWDDLETAGDVRDVLAEVRAYGKEKALKAKVEMPREGAVAEALEPIRKLAESWETPGAPFFWPMGAEYLRRAMPGGEG